MKKNQSIHLYCTKLSVAYLSLFLRTTRDAFKHEPAKHRPQYHPPALTAQS